MHVGDVMCAAGAAGAASLAGALLSAALSSCRFSTPHRCCLTWSSTRTLKEGSNAGAVNLTEESSCCAAPSST